MAQPPPEHSFQYAPPPADPGESLPAPARLFGLPRFAVGLAGGVLLLAAAGATGVTVFLLAAGHGTVLDRMVPAGAAAYGSVNLDPPADQKLNLLNLSHKLPEISSEQVIDRNLNQLLAPAGLSYSGDVKPWLGAQVVGVAGSSSKPDGAFLFDSKNDTAAQQALAKLKAGGLGKQSSWHSSEHGGVTLQVGVAKNQTMVLAYFDHTLLIASSESMADEIIDTDQGKHARLDSTAEYKNITAKLPASRLVTVYVDGHAVAGWADGVLGTFPNLTPGGQLFTPPQINRGSVKSGLQAFKGFGFAIAAQPDGLAADLEVDLDVSKLTADQRALYQRAARPNAALASVPSTSVAVLAITDLDTLLKSIPAGAGESFGLTPGGLASKLSGDAALEVEPDGGSLGVGGVIGTTDPAGLRAELNRLAGEATGTGLDYAVVGQDLLVATSPAELARLQAARTGAALAASANYQKAATFAVSGASSLVYVDIDGVAKLADAVDPSFGRQVQQQRGEWSAVRAVLVTSGGSSVRIHLVIE